MDVDEWNVDELEVRKPGTLVRYMHTSPEQDKALGELGVARYEDAKTFWHVYSNCTWSGLLPDAIVLCKDGDLTILTWEGEVLRG